MENSAQKSVEKSAQKTVDKSVEKSVVVGELVVDVIKSTKNIWFVWSKMSYSGDMEGCHVSGQQTTTTTEM